MEEIISKMTTGQITGSLALLVLVASYFVEISPIKINPWGRVGKTIGRAINGELIEKVDALDKRVTSLKNSVDERAATDARTKILRFGDECLHGEKHSKEHFDQILRDITEYEQYCADHPDFKNNMAVLTIGSIKSIYQQRLRDHDFL